MPARGGRVDYAFVWLLRRPMRAVFDPARRTLAFPALLPAVPADARAALGAIVAARATPAVPAHKRLDRRRAAATLTSRRGDLSLAVAIRGGNYGYAVRGALTLINDLFLALQERHPEYLVERFGMSAE